MPQSEFTGGDRFELRRRLGEGSFGVVYEAFDRQRGSRIALKTLKQADAIALYNLKREFRTLVDISHPNLVNLHELLSVDDQWLITMDLIQGRSFTRHVRGVEPSADESTDETIAMTPDVPVDLGEAPEELARSKRSDLSFVDLAKLRSALRSLAEGLVALHSANIIHRDIKPSNVLVSEDGHVTILDFGLVSDQSRNPEGTLLRVAGTPAYMAPEQARGAGVGKPSDWFAVGIMLWEALVGHRPKRGPSPEIIPPPSSLVRGIPTDLEKLCQALLRQNAHQRPSGTEILQRLGGATSATSAAPLSRDAGQQGAVFVGRQQELEVLEGAYQRTEAGEAALAFVHGSSGMGKTALVHHFLDDLRQRHPSAVILRGRCYERESVPYKSVDSLIDALAIYLSRLTREEVEGLLPRNILALARLFPVLRRVEAVVEAKRRFVDISDSRELRRRAFQALRELLTRLADREPTVLFIDDLHWGDTDSAALLLEVLRPPDPPAALLLGTYRSEEIDTSPSLQAFLSIWSTQTPERIVEVEVGEFTDEDSRDLAVALLGRDDAHTASRAEDLLAESGGNPFFLEKLLTSEQSVSTTGPDGDRPTSLGEMLRATVAQVSSPGQQLLRTLAVVGQPAALDVVTSAADLESSISLLRELENGRLVRVRTTHSGEEIEIYHDRIRRAVLATLSADDLSNYHRRLLETIQGTGRGDAERLAVHAEGCGELQTAARYTARAASEAADALAFDRAARLYDDAIRLRGRDDEETRVMRVHRGDALVNAGRGSEAAAVLLSAVEGAGLEEVLELRRRAAQHYLMSGHLDEGLEAIKSVLATQGMSLPKTPRQALLSIVLNRLRLRLRGLQFRERDPSEIPAADLRRIDSCWAVSSGLILSNTIYALDFQNRGLLLALKAGDPLRVARFLSLETVQRATAGSSSIKRTEQVVQAAAAAAKRTDQPFAVGISTLYSGCARALNGEWARARALSDDAEKTFREKCTGVAWEIDTCQLFSLFSQSWLGELEEMGTRARAIFEDAEGRGDLLMTTYLQTDIAPRIHMVEDNPDKARAAAERGIAKWPFPGFHRQHQYALRSTVEILLYEGKGRQAWAALGEQYGALKESLLLRAQMNRVIVSDYRGRSALAAAIETDDAGERRRLFGIARAEIKNLRQEHTAWGDPLAALLAASLALATGTRAEARLELATAEVGFETTQMALHAAATRARRGQLRGGEAGRTLTEEGIDWMRRHGIRKPHKWLRLLSPVGGGLEQT